MNLESIILLIVGITSLVLGISVIALAFLYNRIRKAVYKRKIRKAEEQYEEAIKNRRPSESPAYREDINAMIKRQMQELRNEAFPEYWTPVYETKVLRITREKIDPERLKGDRG